MNKRNAPMLIILVGSIVSMLVHALVMLTHYQPPPPEVPSTAPVQEYHVPSGFDPFWFPF